MKKILIGLSLVTSCLMAIENNQYDELFETYSKRYNIPNGFLKQIAFYESGLKHDAKKDALFGGTEKGLFLINDKWHPEIKADGFNPEVSISVAAKLANTCILKYGKTKKTIGCFNKYPEDNVKVLLKMLNK